MLPRQSRVSPEQSQTGCSRLVGVGVGVADPSGVAVGGGVGVMVGVEVATGVIVGETRGSVTGALSTTAPEIHMPLTSRYQVPSV